MKRIIIVHWNKSTGPEPIIQYPPEKSFPPNDLFLKIWARHELNKGETIIEFTSEQDSFHYISIVQKFEGEIYFLILAYSNTKKVENIFLDTDILASIGKNLVELINTNKITRVISEAFNAIKDYKADKEENLLNFFKNKIKFTILKILRNGVISKTELKNILRQEYGFSPTNLDLVLISFIQENLIAKKNVPGQDEYYFLIKDLIYTRIPPNVLPSMGDDTDKNIILKFESELKDFYLNYDCTSDMENKTILNFLMDKNVFDLIKTLRSKTMSINECLSILNNREDLFNELFEKKFVFEAKGFVYIFSDVRFIKFSPYYMIKTLTKRYTDKNISIDEYLMHLKLLSEQLDYSSSLFNYEII